jgi:methylated-DNA-protein-cysteine methyltransferase-like protein
MNPVHPATSSKQKFFENVWQLVCQIPPGRVATYGQIAALLDPPSGVSHQAYKAFGPRWVGSAMAACPEGIPWQRVVNSRGEISKRSSGISTNQKDLLIEEGVEFNLSGRIDLERFKWDFNQSTED